MRLPVVIGLLAIVVASVVGRAEAAELSFFAGGETDARGQSFSYLGGDVTHTVREPWALALRLVPSYVTYKFRDGDELVSASSPGVSAVAGVKLRWPKFAVGVFGGAEYRDTDLDPDVRTAAMRGETLSPVAQFEVSGELPSRTLLGYFANFNTGDDFIYQKATARQQVTNFDYARPNTLLVGLELIYGRNPDYEFVAVGPIIELYNVPGVFSVNIHGGYRHDATFGSGVYGGVGLWKRF